MIGVTVWTILLGLVAVLTVGIVVPRVGGATPYTVLTGSMAPTYAPGTLVVVRPVDVADVAVGDVITYQLRSGDPTVVTHRVVGVGSALGTGERSLRTQGDANAVADPEPVREVQVRGEVWYAIPHLGRLSNLLSGSTRDTLTVLVAAGLAVYAAAMFTSASLERRRRDQQDRTREAGVHRS